MDDIESARVSVSQPRQLRIFYPSPRDLCRKTGLNWLAALWLYEQGFLSFDPATAKTLQEEKEAELLFLGSLVSAGCDEQMLKHLLRGLEKPYQYQLNMIYYDWTAQAWRLIPRLESFDRDELVQEWLDELSEEGDIETLRSIEGSLQAAIKAASEADKRP